MEKQRYFHLGYFNEIPDIRKLSQKPADEIVKYFKKGYGHFYKNLNPDEESDLYLEEEIESGAVARNETRFTSDRLYAVVDTSWTNWQEEHKDSEDGDCSDCYIDIYQLDFKPVH